MAVKAHTFIYKREGRGRGKYLWLIWHLKLFCSYVLLCLCSRVSGKCHNLEAPIKDCAICLLIRANYSNFACKFNT